jgi:hypothetical protein
MHSSLVISDNCSQGCLDLACHPVSVWRFTSKVKWLAFTVSMENTTIVSFLIAKSSNREGDKRKNCP